MLACMLALPPVGSAKTASQTRHLTTVAHLLNIICSFLHFSHFTFRNLLLSSILITQQYLGNAHIPIKECGMSAESLLSETSKTFRFLQANKPVHTGLFHKSLKRLILIVSFLNTALYLRPGVYNEQGQ